MAEPLVGSHVELHAAPDPTASNGTARRVAQEEIISSLSLDQIEKGRTEQARSTKLRVIWAELCRDLGVDIDIADRWWERILQNHTAPHRKYHNLRHLIEAHEHFDRYAGSLADPNAVQLAIFFQTFTYSAVNGSPQNEKESATQLDLFCQEALPRGEPLGKEKGEFTSKVVRWVTGSSKLLADEAWEMDGKYFMDIVTARFGEPWERFEEYIARMEAEFEHLPKVIFLEGRLELLKFLREQGLDSSYRSIYATMAFRTSHGAQALENTKREMELLSKRLEQYNCCARTCARSWSLIWLGYGKYGIVAMGLLLLAIIFPVLWLIPALILTWSVLYGFVKLACFGASYNAYPYPAPTGTREGTVVIAGSYNPPHMGHLEMIKYLSQTHEAVVAVVGVNPEKIYSVNPYQRQEIMRAMCSELGLTNVKVVVWSGMVFKLAKAMGASRMYRGIRTWRLDGSGEKWLEFLNMTVPFMYGAWPIPTNYLQGAPHLANLSSSLLRRRLADEEDISDLVPPGCTEFVRQAYIPGTFVVEAG